MQVALVCLRVLPVKSNVFVFFKTVFGKAVYKAFIGSVKRCVLNKLYNAYIYCFLAAASSFLSPPQPPIIPAARLKASTAASARAFLDNFI